MCLHKLLLNTSDILNVFFICLAGTQTVLDAEVTEGIHFYLLRHFSSDNTVIFQYASKPFLGRIFIITTAVTEYILNWKNDRIRNKSCLTKVENCY